MKNILFIASVVTIVVSVLWFDSALANLYPYSFKTSAVWHAFNLMALAIFAALLIIVMLKKWSLTSGH